MIPIWFRIQLKHVETSMDSCWNLSLESLSLLLVVISGQVYALTCDCLNGCSFVAFWCFPYYLRASWALIQHHDLEVKAIAESIPRSVEVWRECWLDGSASVHERKKGAFVHLWSTGYNRFPTGSLSGFGMPTSSYIPGSRLGLLWDEDGLETKAARHCKTPHVDPWVNLCLSTRRRVDFGLRPRRWLCTGPSDSTRGPQAPLNSHQNS